MQWLLELLIGLLRIFLPAIIKSAKPTSEDASPNLRVRSRLRRRVRETWGHTLGIVLLIFFGMLLVGCSTHTVYVPDGTPVRLREPLDDVKVWVLDSNGTPVPGEMDIPEGWYCLPLPPEEDEGGESENGD